MNLVLAANSILYTLYVSRFVMNLYKRLSIFSHASGMALGMAMSVGQLVHHFGPDGNFSTTRGWVGKAIHGYQTMNPDGFGDPLTFRLVPP